MADLRDIAWMIRQWGRFRRLLSGATVIIWLLCCSGIVFIGGDDDTEWLVTRMALVIMLLAATGVSIWLFVVACKELGRLEIEAKKMRRARSRKQRGVKRPAE